MKTADTNEFKPSNRVYRDIETNEIFTLYVNSNTHTYKLISEGSEKFAKGTEVNGWYLSAFHPMTIRLNTKKEVNLSGGEFYNLKEGEEVKSRRFLGYDKFEKV